MAKVEIKALEQMDLQCHRARDVAGVAGDFAVTLQCVHVTQIDATAGGLDWTDQDSAGPHGVDVHVAVGAVFQLFGCQSVFVRRADQEGAEVAGIV